MNLSDMSGAFSGLSFVERRRLYEIIRETETTDEAKEASIAAFSTLNQGHPYVDSFVLGLAMAKVLKDHPGDEDYLKIRWRITNLDLLPAFSPKEVKSQAENN